LSGLYLGSTADTIVIGTPPDIARGPRCAISSNRHRSQTWLIPRSSIEQIELLDGPRPCRPASSLLRLLGAKLECIALLCQLGEHRFSLLGPFVSGQ